MLFKNKAQVNVKTQDDVTPLHYAAYHGHYDIVKLLVENGANLNDISQKSQHLCNLPLDPLRCAAYNGHLIIVEYLLSKGANLNELISTNALELGSLNGHTKIVSFFLQKGGKITKAILEAAVTNEQIYELLNSQHKFDTFNTRDSDRYTLLHFAAKYGKTNIIKQLIEKKLEVNTSLFGSIESPLFLAVQNNHIRVVEVLMQHKLYSESENLNNILKMCVYQQNTKMLEILLKNIKFLENALESCLSLAIKFNSIDIFRILIKYVNIKKQQEFALDLLYESIFRGYKIVTQIILSEGIDVNETASKISISPLCVASIWSADLTEYLIVEKGAKINVDEDIAERNPLYFAVTCRNADIVKILVDHGANVLVKDGKQRTVIELAVANNDIDIVSCLLATNQININMITHQFFSLLHIAAQFGRLEMTKFLCNNGADINARNEYDSKPIHDAARNGHIRIVEYYLNKGLSVNECAFVGKTLLHIAVLDNENSHMIIYLHSKGANINQQCEKGLTPLDLAILKGNDSIEKTLLSLGAIYSIIQTPYSSVTKQLFKVVKTDDFKEIERLVTDHEAQLNAKNDDDRTILHIASSKGRLNSVRIILKYGGDPNILSKNRIAALHYAAQSNHFEIVKALLIHGAIFNMKSEKGKTALDFTENQDIRRLLQIIDKCFAYIKIKSNKIFGELNRVKDFEVLKAVFRAKNEKSETLVLAAIRCSLESIDLLQQYGQEVNALQLNTTFNKLAVNEQYSDLAMFLKNTRNKRVELFGKNCPGNLSIDYMISKAIYKQGKFVDSLDLLEEVLRKQTELFGDNAKDTLTSGSAKALILHRLGRNTEALELIKSVIKKVNANFGKSNETYLECMNHLGLIYQGMDNYEDALKAHRDLFGRYLVLYGANGILTLVAQNNVAINLTKLKNYDEALDIFKEVYRRRKVVLGPNNSDTLRTLHNMLPIYMEQNKLVEALELTESVFKEQKKSLGVDHRDTLHTQANLAALMGKLSKPFLALKHFNEALPKLQIIIGPRHPFIIHYQELLEQIKMILKVTEVISSEEILWTIKMELNKNIESGNLNEVERLVNLGADVNGRDAAGLTPLHFAVRTNFKKIIEFLLENTADPIQLSNKGNSSLHTVASVGHTETAEILINHVKKNNFPNFNDFLNGQTKSGKMTALHVAAKSGFVEIVKLLLKHGAMFDLIDVNGKTAEELCRNQEIAILLKNCREIFLEASKTVETVMSTLKKLKAEKKRETISIVTSARNNENKCLLDFIKESKLGIRQKGEMVKEFIQLLLS